MLTLWGRTSAYSVQKVQWFIEELGIEYLHVNVGGSSGRLDSEEFLAMNPHGHIPIVKDGEQILWESNTILRYLAATYSKNEYWKESPVKRNIYERWMDWELSTLQPIFLTLFWGVYRTPENKKNIRKITHYQQLFEQKIKILDSHLEENQYISGINFGLGDICVGTCFYRYFNMGIKALKPKNLTRWYELLSNRPCYQKVIQVPFDELKGRYPKA